MLLGDELAVSEGKDSLLRSLVLLDDLSGSSNQTSSSGSDETDLSTSWSISSNGGWVTDVLVVTTTVRMLDWVHCNTSNSWPVVSLGLVLVPGVGSLEEWLLNSLTSSANSNHGSARSWDGLSDTGWESNSGLLTILGVSDDDGGASRGSGEGSSISGLAFAVGDNGSFWESVDWENVSNGEGGCKIIINLIKRRIEKTYLWLQRRRIGQCTFPRRR